MALETYLEIPVENASCMRGLSVSGVQPAATVGRPTTAAGLFAADGEILIGPMGRARGRPEIQALMEAALGGSVGETVHVISGPVVALDGDVATSEVMWTVLARTAEGNLAVTMTGRHVDDLVREEGSWRIRRRRGLVDLPDPGRMR